MTLFKSQCYLLLDATCQLCHQADETISHFLLDCPSLEQTRQPVLGSIIDIAISFDERTNLLQLILDSIALSQILDTVVIFHISSGKVYSGNKGCHTCMIKHTMHVQLLHCSIYLTWLDMCINRPKIHL